ncbi:MAG: AmmeMemoRadiSam system radical SAM enzyme [Negativicutes bacterium]|nr:AmmeMemoRadiSam system radical SAM enzyme [Negativicutes bacterium]
MREAKFYKPHAQGILCELCPQHCVISAGRTGYCRVRRNLGGVLYTENYAACTGYALDPIEKKPLYHFYPGKMIFSIGTWGCNFSCQFCQNWEIAQASPATQEISPEQAVAMAKRAGPGNIGIAYTYSEPGVWYEYIFDTAELAHEHGLKNVLVTNGYINREPLAALLPVVAAMNIDVKAFNNDFYRKVCGGRLESVKATVEFAASRCHVEITTLIIPGLNDSEHEIRELARWLGGLDADIPLHFSRYFPRYKLEVPPTPAATLERARTIAREYLNYVYVGNMAGDGMNTYCPACGMLLIERLRGASALTDKQCPKCGQPIYIAGEIAF